MKILQLDVQGFRSLKNISWKPADLNILIGPNASGKSNVLHALDMISASAQGRLGEHIRRHGGMEPILYDGSADGFRFSIRYSPLEEHRDPEKDSLTYEMQIERPWDLGLYCIKRELLGKYYRVRIGEEEEPFKLLERIGQKGHIFDENQRQLIAHAESINEEETLLSSSAGPFLFGVNKYVYVFQKYLAANRIYHDVYLGSNSPIRQPAITQLEERVSPSGENLVSVLHTLYEGQSDVRDDIDAAMCAAFGDDYKGLVFPPASDRRIQLRVAWKSLKRQIPASDLSDGTLRFLFLLAVLMKRAPLIAIDEPETGLHPSMLPIIAEYAVEASRHCQVILTTHSPQFLSAFRETKPTTTIVQWRDGETVLNTLDNEALKDWLEHYSLGELFESGELENFG